MSLENNKAIVCRFIEEGINPANMAVFDELLDPNVIDHYAPPGFPPGREGWKMNRHAFLTAFPDGHWSIEAVVAEGSLVVVRCPFTGTHQGELFGIPASGQRVSISSIHICRLDNGTIVEHWGNGDDLGMMMQIGAIPAPAQTSLSGSS